MADEATVNAAIQTVQSVLGRYDPAYQGGRDDGLVSEQLPQGLYEHIENLSYLLSQIDPVARSLNAQDVRIDDAYNPALGNALQEFASSGAYNDFAQAVRAGDNAAITRLVRQNDLPAFFEQNPQEFVHFIENDLDSFLQAMSVLEEAEHLSAPPVSVEQKQLQDATLPKLEDFLRDEFAYHIESVEAYKQRTQDALDAGMHEAEVIAANRQLATINTILETLNKGREYLDDAEFSDFASDENAQQALSTYVYFLQSHSPVAGFDEQSGNYTQGYESHIAALLEGRQDRLQALAENSDRDMNEEVEYQNLVRLAGFQALMGDMVESGLYRKPAADPNAGAPDVRQAHAIVGQAVDTMVRGNYVEVSPSMSARENGEFDMASRIALQAFVVDLKYFTNYGGDPSRGVYNDDFAEHLMQVLNNPQNRQGIADRYFKGDLEAAQNLKMALDIYANPEIVPDLAGQPSNLAQDNLITKPRLKAVEADVLQSVIARTPDSELAGINALVTTLSGYGLEDTLYLSDDPQESARLARITESSGQSRAQVLGDLFETVYDEAQAALEREGRPASDLQDEISRRIGERLDDITSATAIFSSGRVHELQKQIDYAVEVALSARENTIGDEGQKFAAAREVFGLSVPSPEKFIIENGPHTHGSTVFHQPSMSGVLPPVLDGFAGQIEKAPASLTEIADRDLQSINSMIAGMESGYEKLSRSPVARETLQEVRAGLEDNRALLESVYNQSAEKGPDGELVVSDRHGESILLRDGEDGLDIIYLDAQGIDSVSDVPTINVSEEFGYDRLMIKAAMAGFQAENQNIEHVRHYAPEFFEVAGRHYVIGVDRETSMVQIHRLEPEFLSVTNSAQLNYATGPNARTDAYNSFMENDAYRFLRENYDGFFSPAGSPDRAFQAMLQEIQRGSGEAANEAEKALELFSRRQEFDPVQNIPVTQLPRVEEDKTIDAAREIAASRPEDVRSEAFLYFHEDGNDGKILLTVPAMKEETSGEPPNEVTRTVFDPEGDPDVLDITDPDVFMRMRDRLIQWDSQELSLRLDAAPPDMLNEPQFAFFRNWLETGAPPPVLESGIVKPAPRPPQASEAGINALYESAAGFVQNGADITLGSVVEDMDTVHAVLGYDPVAQFNQSTKGDGAGVAIVHGVEPGVWNGTSNAHEFFIDHVLVTFEVDGEVKAVALNKDDFMHNPMRLPALLDGAYPDDTPPKVLMADRDHAAVGSREGIQVPATDLWHTVWDNKPEYHEMPERVPGGGQVLQPGIPLFWPRDAELYQQRLEEHEHSAMHQPDNGRSNGQDFASLYAENCDDITCMPGMNDGASGGVAPDRITRPDLPHV